MSTHGPYPLTGIGKLHLSSCCFDRRDGGVCGVAGLELNPCCCSIDCRLKSNKNDTDGAGASEVTDCKDGQFDSYSLKWSIIYSLVL